MVLDTPEAFQLREPEVSYVINLGTKNDDVEVENGHFWDNNIET
jgi:hypothetical protein